MSPTLKSTRGGSHWTRISGCSPWSRPLMFGSANSEHPRLTNGEIISEEFQPMWSQSTNVTDGRTDRRTDRRHAIARPRFALKVHRAAKIAQFYYSEKLNGKTSTFGIFRLRDTTNFFHSSSIQQKWTLPAESRIDLVRYHNLSAVVAVALVGYHALKCQHAPQSGSARNPILTTKSAASDTEKYAEFNGKIVS